MFGQNPIKPRNLFANDSLFAPGIHIGGGGGGKGRGHYLVIHPLPPPPPQPGAYKSLGVRPIACMNGPMIVPCAQGTRALPQKSFWCEKKSWLLFWAPADKTTDQSPPMHASCEQAKGGGFDRREGMEK